jgi:hypothetical protein
MFFPFTFTMSLPGIMNLFTKPPYLLGGTTDSRIITNGLQRKRLLSLAGCRPHPSCPHSTCEYALGSGIRAGSAKLAVLLEAHTGHMNPSVLTNDSWNGPIGHRSQEQSQHCTRRRGSGRRMVDMGTSLFSFMKLWVCFDLRFACCIVES